MSEEAIGALVGSLIGTGLVLPLVAYGLYRLDKWEADRTRERKAAIRAAKQRHSSNRVIGEFETTPTKFRREAS